VSLLKIFYNFICPTSADNSLTLLDLNEKVNLIMTTLADIKVAIALVGKEIAKEKNEVATALTDLNKQVADLKVALADGEAINAADLDSILSSIKGIDESVKSIYDVPVQQADVAPVEETLVVEPTSEVIVGGVEIPVEAIVDVITPIEEISEEVVVTEYTPEVTVGPG